MRPREIDRFFEILSRFLKFRVRIVLTGGAVPVLQGSGRATHDLDFQIIFSTRSRKAREVFQEAVEKASRITGIAAQYDETIETWSSISWPRRRRMSRLYRRIGRVEVHLLEPLLWSIGKLSRYLASDVEDLVMILKRARIRPEEAARGWGEALGGSPASSAQPVFKRQVIHFIREHGREIWREGLNLSSLEDLFLKSARGCGVRHRTKGPLT